MRCVGSVWYCCNATRNDGPSNKPGSGNVSRARRRITAALYFSRSNVAPGAGCQTADEPSRDRAKAIPRAFDRAASLSI